MTNRIGKRLERLESAMQSRHDGDRQPGLTDEEKEVLLQRVEKYAAVEAEYDELYGKDGAVGALRTLDESLESAMPTEKRLLRQRIIDGCRG